MTTKFISLTTKDNQNVFLSVNQICAVYDDRGRGTIIDLTCGETVAFKQEFTQVVALINGSQG